MNEVSEGPVAEFCAELRRLVQASKLDRAALSRRLGYSRSQLYEILNGRISRPPEWDKVVEPLVRVCTGNDNRAVQAWRRRHDVLVTVCTELKRQQGNRRLADLPGLVGAARVVPAQLPADVEIFMGRSQELANLDRLLLRPSDAMAGAGAVGAGATAVVISAVSGTAGVGKTALALRWAHRVRGQFPDGQLYVNLRGFDPDQPLSAADALAGFLRALGVAGQNIPIDVEERAAAYRSLLDRRRMLIVLDNASSVEQVRLLLPGSPSCAVLVTSRDSLAGLVARYGARRVEVDLLPLEDAVALLAALIGERVQSEVEAAVTLARLCARLPLALRVAAELAVARQDSNLGELVEELGGQRRLDLLDAGADVRTAVRGVFSWSYRHLPFEAARAFRLIGLHPGPNFDPYAVVALANTSRDEAQQIVDLLTRAHLIQNLFPGRSSMHDLLRAYAAHLAGIEDSEDEQKAALTRLFDYYLATAAAAMDTLVPAERHRRPRVSAPGTPIPPISDPASARTWLDLERDTLTAVSAYTAARGWLAHTAKLSTTLYRYLDASGHFPEGLTIHRHALHAARDVGDTAAEADALFNLGHIYWQQGRYKTANEHLEQAFKLFRTIGQRVGEARALLNLGTIFRRQGNYQQAADHYQQALTIARDIGDRVGEANALIGLGTVLRRQGHYEQAAHKYRQALTIAREIGDRVGEANALDNLGTVYRRQGHYEQAINHHQCALALFREIGDRHGEANSLLDLGTALRRQGHYEQVTDYHQRALALFREIGDRHGEACALNRLGETLVATRRPKEAIAHHTAALTMASQIGDRYEQVRAHNGLAHTHRATGDLDHAVSHHISALALASEIGERYEQARAHNGLAHTYHTAGDLDQAHHHWNQALALYTDLGVPDANDVHTSWLSKLI